MANSPSSMYVMSYDLSHTKLTGFTHSTTVSPLIVPIQYISSATTVASTHPLLKTSFKLSFFMYFLSIALAVASSSVL